MQRADPMSKVCLTAVLLLATLPAQAAPDYVASVIEPREEIQTSLMADFNGDGRQDLLLAVWSEAAGRELLLYYQGENGQFPGSPSQRVELKSDIIAFAVADLRDEPGEELIFLTRSAIYSYSTRKSGYADNLKKLADWELLNSVPHTKSIASLGRLNDYNQDGFSDLLLPGQKSWGLLYGVAEGFAEAKLLPAPHLDPFFSAGETARLRLSMENGLQLVAEDPSPFAGLFPGEARTSAFERRSLGRFGSRSYIMDVERWLPLVQPARISDDQGWDLVFLDDPLATNFNPASDELKGQRLNLIRQQQLSEAGWQGQLPSRGEVLLRDVDGDGLDDVLILEHQGSKDSRLLLFRNREGSFNFSAADQLLRFSGYEVEVELQDLNGDGRSELIVSYYSIGSVDSLRSGSMQRSTLIYPQADDDLIFARRPASRYDERFSADGVRGLAERPHFSADVSGNGHKDWVAVDEQGALIARAIDSNLQVEAKPFWRFAPVYMIHSIVPGNFSGAGGADFILLHQNAVTVLVSRHD